MLNNPPTVKVKYKSRGNRIDFRIMNLSDYEAMAEKDRLIGNGTHLGDG